MKTSVLVVGGGIAGMVAALRENRNGHAVTLVEKQPILGGLLASHQPPGSEHGFDHGTHIPAETGDDALDQLLFGWFRPDEWQTLPVLKSGNYWNGKFNSQSPCLDLRSLPPDRYGAAVAELIRCAPPGATRHRNAAEQLAENYGENLLASVFSPAFRKFYAQRAQDLAPDANLLLGLSRFICLDPVRARGLKKTPALDRKLAFHSSRETAPGVKPARIFYPRAGGVGRWVEGLERRLAEAGVRLRTNTQVKRLDFFSGTAVLADDADVQFDRVVWTLPAALLLRACGHPAAAGFSAPALSTIHLYHFVCDRAPVTDNYYVTCYDENLRTFRVTFYSNLQPSSGGGVRITVEVLTPRAGVPAEAAAIFGELKEMGLLASPASYSACHRQTLAGGFPIPTLAHRSETNRAAEIAATDLPRARLLGRASGQCFFMRDVLLDAWLRPVGEARAEPHAA